MNQNKLTSLQIYIIDNHMKLSYYVKGMSWHATMFSVDSSFTENLSDICIYGSLILFSRGGGLKS